MLETQADGMVVLKVADDAFGIYVTPQDVCERNIINFPQYRDILLDAWNYLYGHR